MNASQEIRILSIDLSNRSFEFEELPQVVVRQFIGGRGLGSYLLYKRVPAKTDPLSADNHLIFTAGPMSGTGFFYSSKSNVTTTAPKTASPSLFGGGGTRGMGR